MAEALLGELSALALVSVAGLLVVAGWSAHAAWLRGRTRVISWPGGYALLVGRAVAGVWRDRSQAGNHLRHVQAQISGRRG